MTSDNKGREIQLLPPIKRYVNAIERHLRLPLKEKARVMSDVSTGIIARKEAGETYEEIMRDMGTPRQVAERLNAAMGVSDRPSPWRFLFLVLLVLLVVGVIAKFSYEQGTLAGVSLMQGAIASRFFVGSSGGTGVIGGADGPTAVFVASAFPSLLYAPLALACALMACYLLARRPQRWLAALRFGIASAVLFWARTAVELAAMGLYGVDMRSLLSALASSLLTPAFWLSAAALIVALRRKKQAQKEL